MSVLQRHVLGQVAVAVSLAVGLFVFVLLTGVVLREVFPHLSGGVIGWGQFFQLIPVIAPGGLPYALPLGMLTGVLTVLGRMSAQNEILAMKAAGMSVWRITSPIFLLAGGAVLLSLYINFEQAPSAVDEYKRVLLGGAGGARPNPERLIVPGEFVTFKGGEKGRGKGQARGSTTIYAVGREGATLRKVWLWQGDEKGRAERVIRAESAELRFDIAEETFELTFHNAAIEAGNRRRPDDFSTPVQSQRAAVLPVSVPLGDLLSALDKYNKKLRYCRLGELLELRRTGARPGGALPASGKECRVNSVAAAVEIQSRLASAFGVLSLAMLAIPLGIKTGRSETLANIAIALVLAITFYALTVVFAMVKDPDWRPDLLVWIPNFLFQGVAAVLLRRLAKR